VGDVGNPVRHSVNRSHFSKCPEFLNHDLENPPIPQTPSTQPFRFDSHFSYAHYGYYWFFYYLFF
jgi:hypothetical protein